MYCAAHATVPVSLSSFSFSSRQPQALHVLHRGLLQVRSSLESVGFMRVSTGVDQNNSHADTQTHSQTHTHTHTHTENNWRHTHTPPLFPHALQSVSLQRTDQIGMGENHFSLSPSPSPHLSLTISLSLSLSPCRVAGTWPWAL